MTVVRGQFTDRRRGRSSTVAALLREADLSAHVETPSRSDGSVTTVRSFAAADAAELEEIVRSALDGDARVELVLAISWSD